MSKPKIIKELKKSHPKLKSSQLENIVDLFFENIKDNLIKNNTIEIRKPPLGSFFIKKLKEKRNAINPRTKEKLYVPEKKKIRFRASKKLLEMLNK